MSDPGNVPGSIEENETSLRLGATISGAQAFPRLAALDPTLGDVIRRFGSVDAPEFFLGDLADGAWFGELAPYLIAFGAYVELRHGDERRMLPLEDLFSHDERQGLRPGELLTSLTAPKLRAYESFRARAVSPQVDGEFSAALGAFKFAIRNGRVASARIVFGGLGERPTRAATTEAFAVGLRIADEETWRGALDALALDFPPIVNQRAAATSRALVARDLLLQTLLELRGATGPVVS